MKKILLMLILTIFTTSLHAGSIGFGKIIAIKNYDFDFVGSKSIKVYFDIDPSHKLESCRESGYIRGIITIDSHSEASVSRMLSMLVSAQAASKKVRLFSEGNECEIDFVSIQDVYF